LWVVEKQTKKGDLRNYIDKVTPARTHPLSRSAQHKRAQQAAQQPAVQRVQVQGLPDDFEDEVAF
jgi:hypothetical protein